MWVEHPVYNNYLVSSFGEIRHKKNKNPRKPRKDRYGYLRINILHEGKHKTKTIHRLVAECFLKNPENLKTVNHKDKNKLNNNVQNLEWMSFSDNTKIAWDENHPSCKPIEIDGVLYRSLRHAGRETIHDRHYLSKLMG